MEYPPAHQYVYGHSKYTVNCQDEVASLILGNPRKFYIKRHTKHDIIPLVNLKICQNKTMQ